MPNSNSQEQTIFRNLSGKIQMEFYDDGQRFPSAKEIAERYQVSYCPAQRALKMLENQGLIKLCRGKSTVVLTKPYEDYLKSDLFKRRTAALLDLSKSLKLISPVICLQSICRLQPVLSSDLMRSGRAENHSGRHLYLPFEQSLHTLGSQTALSLYYDISAFVVSAYLDIIYVRLGKEGADLFLKNIAAEYQDCIRDCRSSSVSAIRHRLEHLSDMFHGTIEDYLSEIQNSPETGTSQIQDSPETGTQEAFRWEPHKGRTRYCDDIAIDMVCKINQNVYPMETLLPNTSVLADIYHVSEITIRRTIGLLNKLGLVRTFNGIGTRVVSSGDSTIPHKLRDLMLDDNMKIFLEAYQLLAVTGEAVFLYTFPYIPAGVLDGIARAASITDEKTSMVAVISAGMQAVVRCCPLAAICEIYSKITLLLLKGSVLQLNETGAEHVPEWPHISGSLFSACQSQDSALFAQTYRILFEHSFTETRRLLLDIGCRVEGVLDTGHTDGGNGFTDAHLN